jgi:alkaline phosphatase
MPYTETTVQDLILPLIGMETTANGIVEMSGRPAEAAGLDTSMWGIELTDADMDEIDALKENTGMSYALARVVSKNHTVIGWTTHGHNGEDVPVWIYPYADAIGTIDNTDLAHSAMAMWAKHGGVRTLDQLTSKLYINVEDIFPGQWELDQSDPANPVLVVRDNGAEFRMPISKDYLQVGEREYDLGSLVVYAPARDRDLTVIEDRVYIPERAVELIGMIDGDDDEDEDQGRGSWRGRWQHDD